MGIASADRVCAANYGCRRRDVVIRIGEDYRATISGNHKLHECRVSLT